MCNAPRIIKVQERYPLTNSTYRDLYEHILSRLCGFYNILHLQECCMRTVYCCAFNYNTVCDHVTIFSTSSVDLVLCVVCFYSCTTRYYTCRKGFLAPCRWNVTIQVVITGILSILIISHRNVNASSFPHGCLLYTKKCITVKLYYISYMSLNHDHVIYVQPDGYLSTSGRTCLHVLSHKKLTIYIRLCNTYTSLICTGIYTCSGGKCYT